MGRKLGGWGVCPFLGELSPHLTQSRLGQGLPPYQVASQSIQLFGHDGHGPKTGGGCTPWDRGSWVPIYHNVAWTKAHLYTKCHLDPFNRLATTDMGRKVAGGGCGAPCREGRAGSPSNTMSRPRPTSVPCRILIHPTVWPQYTNVTDRTYNSPIA